MITTINEFKNTLNENIDLTFNINDIKFDTPLYQEVLDLGFFDNTSDLQKQRGVINFISNSSLAFKPQGYFPRDADKPKKSRDNQLEYVIYANGKLRMSSPGTYDKSIGISYDLGHPIENMNDFELILNKLIVSAKRKRFNEKKVNKNL